MDGQKPLTPLEMLLFLDFNPHRLKKCLSGKWYPSYGDGTRFKDLQIVIDNISRCFSLPKYFLDFGSGDGIMALLAAAVGFESYGIEIEQSYVDASEKSKQWVRFIGLEEVAARTHFIQGDAFSTTAVDYSSIDVFYIYPCVGGMHKSLDVYAKSAKEKSLLFTLDNGELPKVDLSQFFTLEYYPSSNKSFFQLISKDPGILEKFQSICVDN